MPRLVPVLLIVFVALIGVSWPPLPLNASIADGVFVLLAVAVMFSPLPKLAWHRSDLAVAIYLLAALPAIAISPDRRASLVELVRELYLVAIYVVMVIVTRRGLADVVARGLIFGGSVLSAIALFFAVRFAFGTSPWPPVGEVMTLPYVGSVLRLRALTPSEAMFACLLTAAVPFGLVRAINGRTWWRETAMMLIAAAFTLSHALSGLAVAIVIAMWPSLTRGLRRAALAGALLVVLGLNVAATASIKSISYGAASYSDPNDYHYAVGQRERHIGDLQVIYNVMSYARIKQVAWRAFLEHPIAGVGLDQFHVETRRAFDDGRLTLAYREIDPHSTIPGRFAETGVIGGVALLFLLLVWGRMAIDYVRGVPARGAAPDYIAFAAAAAFAGLLVSSLNADIMNFRFLWVIAGLMRGLQDANGISIASGRAPADTAGTA